MPFLLAYVQVDRWLEEKDKQLYTYLSLSNISASLLIRLKRCVNFFKHGSGTTLDLLIHHQTETLEMDPMYKYSFLDQALSLSFWCTEKANSVLLYVTVLHFYFIVQKIILLPSDFS